MKIEIAKKITKVEEKEEVKEELASIPASPMSSPHKCSIDKMNARKKHQRRTAGEIDRAFICPYDGCTKYFGSEGSQNLHIKIKHNGGSKTDREKMAKILVEAYADDKLTTEIIDSVDLNLPPGVITKMA